MHRLHQSNKVVSVFYYNYSHNFISHSWNLLTAFVFAAEMSALSKQSQQDSSVDLGINEDSRLIAARLSLTIAGTERITYQEHNASKPLLCDPHTPFGFVPAGRFLHFHKNNAASEEKGWTWHIYNVLVTGPMCRLLKLALLLHVSLTKLYSASSDCPPDF